MANTIDIMISCFDDEKAAIEKIVKETGLPILRITDSTKCGGPKVVIFESYAASVYCEDVDDINDVVSAFKLAPWELPEFAVLLVNDDNGRLSAVITVTSSPDL